MKFHGPFSLLTSFLFLCLFCICSNDLNAGTKSLLFNQAANSDTLTITFKVNGMPACESGIESLLTSQSGVLSANWDSSTKQMTVVFISTILKSTDLHTFLALAGYDTSELRAKLSAYDALSASCKYTREAESE